MIIDKARFARIFKEVKSRLSQLTLTEDEAQGFLITLQQKIVEDRRSSVYTLTNTLLTEEPYNSKDGITKVGYRELSRKYFNINGHASKLRRAAAKKVVLKPITKRLLADTLVTARKRGNDPVG